MSRLIFFKKNFNYAYVCGLIVSLYKVMKVHHGGQRRFYRTGVMDDREPPEGSGDRTQLYCESSKCFLTTEPSLRYPLHVIS